MEIFNIINNKPFLDSLKNTEILVSFLKIQSTFMFDLLVFCMTLIIYIFGLLYTIYISKTSTNSQHQTQQLVHNQTIPETHETSQITSNQNRTPQIAITQNETQQIIHNQNETPQSPHNQNETPQITHNQNETPQITHNQTNNDEINNSQQINTYLPEANNALEQFNSDIQPNTNLNTSNIANNSIETTNNEAINNANLMACSDFHY